jgi:hypothetical protein
MTNALKAAIAAAALATASAAWATPSTTFWTPATNYVQPYLVPHLTYDSYFGEPGAYPIDTGLTMGVLPFEKLQGEVGFDLFYPGKTQNGFLLNAKLGIPEGAYGALFPGISAGAQNIGFEKDVNDLFLLHGEIGKTLPFGNITVGGFYGVNDKLMLDSAGKKQRGGAMASWTSPDIKIGKPALDKIVFLADAMTGTSAFSAIGGGIGLYFTPAIDILAGPVFFLEKEVQPGAAPWLFSLQLDVDVDLIPKPKK